MDTFKLKFTRLQLEIFRFLCMKAGEKFNQSQLAKALGVSPTAIAKSLSLLEKEELVEVKRDPNMNLMSITLERENKRTIELKRAENLKILYETGIADFLEEQYPG